MVAPTFYDVIIVLSGDVVNPIFHITLMIFVKGLPRDFSDIVESITTGLN